MPHLDLVQHAGVGASGTTGVFVDVGDSERDTEVAQVQEAIGHSETYPVGSDGLGVEKMSSRWRVCQAKVHP